MLDRLKPLLAAALLIAPGAAHATDCEPPASSADAAAIVARLAAEADAHPYPRGNYWRVSRNGRASLIYGTYHNYDERIALPASLIAAIREADTLALEVGLPDEAAMRATFLSRLDIFFQIDGPDLRPMFTPDEWNRILDRTSVFQLPEIVANRLKPWVLAAMMFTGECDVLLNAAIGGGVDEMMLDQALDHDVPVIPLETMDELLDLIDDRDFDTDLATLKQLLQLDLRSVDSSGVLVPMYLSGEIMAYWLYAMETLRTVLPPDLAEPGIARLNHLLLERRNHNWLDTLVPLLKKGDAVVGVGALHLPGEHGILNLLAQRGFVVERVTE